MKNFTVAFIIVLFGSCSTTNYYIVRHAEKETQGSNMSSDVPLSSKGKERAEALKNVLQDKKIQNIFSTNTIRTKTTAKPTSDATGVNIDTYDPRNNKLKPEDISDGTFTLTNVGTFGSLMGTPIINQPQVAILAVGAIKKRPVVIETPHGDSIAIRHMMYLSMSYDHRIVDGSLGATFLTAVANELENFNANRDF